MVGFCIFHEGFCQNHTRIQLPSGENRRISSLPPKAAGNFGQHGRFLNDFFKKMMKNRAKLLILCDFFVPARQIRFLPGISKTCQDFSSKKVDTVDKVDTVKKTMLQRRWSGRWPRGPPWIHRQRRAGWAYHRKHGN